MITNKVKLIGYFLMHTPVLGVSGDGENIFKKEKPSRTLFPYPAY